MSHDPETVAAVAEVIFEHVDAGIDHVDGTPVIIWADTTPAAEAVLSALIARGWSPPGEWGPIESAPLDGEAVLIWAAGCGMEVVRHTTIGWEGPEGFAAEWGKFWRPLPAPPQTGDGNG